MKKTMLLLAVAVFGMSAMAQVQVKSVKALPGTAQKGYYSPKFSPKGDFILLTDGSSNGLVRYDLANQKQTVLTTAEWAGHETKISESGKIVLYRHVAFDERGFAQKTIKALNTETGALTTVGTASQNDEIFGLINGEVRVANSKHLVRQRVLTAPEIKMDNVMAGCEDGNLVVYHNNRRVVLNPRGEQSYIWVSISPDQKHLTYTITNADYTSTFVSDLNGKNTVELGYIGEPQWLGNNYLVGYLDLWDNGYEYTHSPMVFKKIDGSYQYVYDMPNHPVIIAPAASPLGNKVAFEAYGDIYMMNVELK